MAKFTFKNYLKELKKSWIMLVIFLVIGLAGGAAYAFSRPVNYNATVKFSVYNSHVDNGSAASPYSQLVELYASPRLLSNIDGAVDEKTAPKYEVKEAPRGIFTVTVTAKDAEKAKSFANTVLFNTSNVISAAFDDATNYRVTVLKEATSAEATVTNSKRIISIAVAALGMLVIAAVIVFVRFDYRSEK